MPIAVTCPRCQAAARVPETMLGQAVRCPHCLMPFRTPASLPAAPPEPSIAPSAAVEEPPIVAEVKDPIDDVVVPVVRVPRPVAAAAKKKKKVVITNAGLRTGLAIGTAAFLAVGAVGAVLFVMAVTQERAPTFHRGFMQPPAPAPVERIAPGDAGLPDFVARSRPRPKPLADVRRPDSREHRESLAGPRRPLPGGFAITPVQLQDANDTVSLGWSSDGSAFLALSRAGRLRRIDYPSLEERRLLEIGQECSGLTASGEGLLVTLRRLEEVWVLDPESLNVRRRIGVAGVREVVSAPDLAIAFAFVRDREDGGVPLRIDLTTGVVSGVALFDTDRGGDDPAHLFKSPALTPDGRFLFALTGDNAPARYRVEDDRLTFETSGRRPETSWGDTIVSPDGHWVSVAGQVFSADDLVRPSFLLPRGATAVGFSPGGRRVFASTRGQLLTIFNTPGGRGPEAAWPDHPATARQLLVHPAGDSVLLRTDAGVLRGEIPQP